MYFCVSKIIVSTGRLVLIATVVIPNVLGIQQTHKKNTVSLFLCENNCAVFWKPC